MVDPEELPSDSAWQGVCLALAELAARGLLLPSRLHSVTPLLVTALHYEVLRGAHGIGAHVRDAAAYVCWAIAHSFSPAVAAASLQQLCPHLLAVACCDRQVKCRWAAAAAFQEVVGRFGCISDAHALATPTSRGTPHAAAAAAAAAAVDAGDKSNRPSTGAQGVGAGADGSGSHRDEQWVPAGGIAIVNAADVASLASTRMAFTQVSGTIRGGVPRVQGAGAAEACSLHAPLGPEHPLPRSRLPCLHGPPRPAPPARALTAQPAAPPFLPRPPSRHGALLATAALLLPLSACPPSPLLTDALSSLASSLPRLLAPRSFRGRLAADLKVASCCLLSALATALPRAHVVLPASALSAATSCVQDMLGGDGGTLECARARFVSSVQEAAAAALWDLTRYQPAPARTHLAQQIVARHVAILEAASSAASVRRGAVLALQCFLPCLRPSWTFASVPHSQGTGTDAQGQGAGQENRGHEEGGRKGEEEVEGRGDAGGEDESERLRRELAARVVKALCAAATDNRDRRGVTDVAVRAAAVEALGSAATLVAILQAGGGGRGGGDGAEEGKQQENGEKGALESSESDSEVHGGWEGKVGGENVVTALLQAAEDYTEDQRGDVGRLVREASMKALVAWVEQVYRWCGAGESDKGAERGMQGGRHAHGTTPAATPLNASSPQPRQVSLQEWCRAVAGRVVGALLKQAGEKIDGTRQVAGHGLQRLLWGDGGTQSAAAAQTSETAATAVARHTGGGTQETALEDSEGRGGGGGVRRNAGANEAGSGVCRDVDGWQQLRRHVPSDPHFNWMDPTSVFPRIAPLLLLPAYRLPLLSGLLLSAGSLSHPLAPAALHALLALTGAGGGEGEAGERGGERQREEVQGCIAADVVVLLRRYRKQKRVIVPYIKAIAALLQASFFGPLSAHSGASQKSAPPSRPLALLPVALVEGVDAELRHPHPTASVPKMLAAVDLLCLLAAPGCAARRKAVSTLFWLLAVPFPTVRRHCAEQLYLVVLLGAEDASGVQDDDREVALEQASEILSCSDWAAMDDASIAGGTNTLRPLLEIAFS
ncbi:hypothetical protein CLOM_g11750 [Closterium sp. NIES-68]|nr:hypothetical protein CLOM_g11750 [Closterium sp. NIES-68]